MFYFCPCKITISKILLQTIYYSDKENKYVSTEAAEVRGIFLKIKKTPFYDLEKDKTEFFAKEFKLIQIEGEWTIQKEEK